MTKVTKTKRRPSEFAKCLVLVPGEVYCTRYTLFEEDDCLALNCLKCIECINYTELEYSTIVMRQLLASNAHGAHSIVNRPGNTALCTINYVNLRKCTQDNCIAKRDG